MTHTSMDRYGFNQDSHQEPLWRTLQLWLTNRQPPLRQRLAMGFPLQRKCLAMKGVQRLNNLPTTARCQAR